MARLYFLSLFISSFVGMLTWGAAKYADVHGQWQAQAQLQPRGRPVLSRPVVMNGKHSKRERAQRVAERLREVTLAR